MSHNFIIADDHCMIRLGVSIILKNSDLDATIYQASTFLETIQYLSTITADLLILDINFPEGSSLNIIPTLRKIQPDLKILIFSAYKEDIYAVRYLNAGANGYLNKLSSKEEILEAINTVLTTGKFVSKKVREEIVNSYIFKKPTNPLEQLSNREIEIAKLLVDGSSNTDICISLNIQKSTVSTYRNRLFEKLNIHSLSDLIKLFNLYYFNKE